jgi:hypothetical protein
VGRDLIPKLCWYVSRSADDSIARFTEFWINKDMKGEDI